MEVNRDITITYDFFATSHGKGAVDGVGGAIKRQVRQEVVSRRQVVNTASDYATVAQATCQGVTTMYIPKEEVEGDRAVQLDNQVFNGCKVLKGTRKVHHLEVTGPSKVMHSRYKGASNSERHSFK